MRRFGWMLAAALVAGATLSTAVPAQAGEKGEKNEKVVSLDKVPAPVRQTILREAAGATILKIEEETGKTPKIYEAHVQKSANEVIGIDVDASGKVVDRHAEKDEKK
jgi:hypothetical protein